MPVFSSFVESSSFRGLVEKSSFPIFETENEVLLPLPKIQTELFCHLTPTRLDEYKDGQRYTLSTEKEKRSIHLPCKMGLKFERGLRFSDELGSFYIEIASGNACLLVDVIVGGEKVDAFSLPIKEPRFLSQSEIAEHSPFKKLSEARFVGKDRLFSKLDPENTLERIEIPGSEGMCCLKKGDLFVLDDEGWKPCFLSDISGRVHARVDSVNERTVFFEGWGLDEYIRFSVSSQRPCLLETKSDDFISSLRMRSEKQVSCMIDKQIFVLRVGDWVLKENGRWKILKKKDEKTLEFLEKYSGELFTFDEIAVRSGQKYFLGSLYNRERSFVESIEINMQAHKNGASRDLSRRGKGKT